MGRPCNGHSRYSYLCHATHFSWSGQVHFRLVVVAVVMVATTIKRGPFFLLLGSRQGGGIEEGWTRFQGLSWQFPADRSATLF